jgi:beta-barrel assembly-enhancing protease
MMRFVESDNELALVVGHELAHNTLGHMSKKRTNAMIGAILGAILSAAIRVDVSRAGADLGAAAYSQDFEAEADYAGIYYAARAGFNVGDAPKLWRRMAVEHPRAIGHGTTHPDTATRFVALDKTVDEIVKKLETNQALKPEMAPPFLGGQGMTTPASNTSPPEPRGK